MSMPMLSQTEVIAVLLNGGYIKWQKPTLPGTPKFLAYLSDRAFPVGRLSPHTAEILFSAGFLCLKPDAAYSIPGYDCWIYVLGTPGLPRWLESKGGDDDV